MIELLEDSKALYKPCSRCDFEIVMTMMLMMVKIINVMMKRTQMMVLFVVVMMTTMKLRFEGIYEESRAVFLCNQGDGHRGGTC